MWTHFFFRITHTRLRTRCPCLGSRSRPFIRTLNGHLWRTPCLDEMLLCTSAQAPVLGQYWGIIRLLNEIFETESAYQKAIKVDLMELQLPGRQQNNNERSMKSICRFPAASCSRTSNEGRRT